MVNDIGNYTRHARFWNWGGHDRSDEHELWLNWARRYGKRVLIPMCAWGETGAYLAERGMEVTGFDITPEMIAEGKQRYDGIPGLSLLEGDVTDFSFDIPVADFCFVVDFGHLHTVEGIHNALVCIARHLRPGGALVIEAGLPAAESRYNPSQTWWPLQQVYPGLKVWKTGDTRIDADTGRTHISQVFYAEDEAGHIDSFKHEFYMQSYPRETWLSALVSCGYIIKGEYSSREEDPWQAGKATWIVEAVKA